jgi:hypothetical protein
MLCCQEGNANQSKFESEPGVAQPANGGLGLYSSQHAAPSAAAGYVYAMPGNGLALLATWGNSIRHAYVHAGRATSRASPR